MVCFGQEESRICHPLPCGSGGSRSPSALSTRRLQHHKTDQGLKEAPHRLQACPWRMLNGKSMEQYGTYEWPIPKKEHFRGSKPEGTDCIMTYHDLYHGMHRIYHGIQVGHRTIWPESLSKLLQSKKSKSSGSRPSFFRHKHWLHRVLKSITT